MLSVGAQSCEPVAAPHFTDVNAAEINMGPSRRTQFTKLRSMGSSGRQQEALCAFQAEITRLSLCFVKHWGVNRGQYLLYIHFVNEKMGIETVNMLFQQGDLKRIVANPKHMSQCQNRHLNPGCPNIPFDKASRNGKQKTHISFFFFFKLIVMRRYTSLP